MLGSNVMWRYLFGDAAFTLTAEQSGLRAGSIECSSLHRHGFLVRVAAPRARFDAGPGSSFWACLHVHGFEIGRYFGEAEEAELLRLWPPRSKPCRIKPGRRILPTLIASLHGHMVSWLRYRKGMPVAQLVDVMSSPALRRVSIHSEESYLRRRVAAVLVALLRMFIEEPPGGADEMAGLLETMFTPRKR